MTEQLLKDVKWKTRNFLCTLLALIPIIGWMGFLLMAKKSGRKQFRIPGIIYGVLSMSAFLAKTFSEGRLLPIAIREEIGTYALIMLFVLWLACLVHTFIRSGQYLQYLALRVSGLPERHPLTRDRRWRRNNLLWMLWSLIPGTCGLGVLFVGCRLNNRKLKFCGIFTELLVAVCLLARLTVNSFYLALSVAKTTIPTVSEFMIICSWAISLIWTYAVREEYLDARALVWEEHTRKQPNLLNGKWRRRNSAWQIWTYIPVVGGLGIAIAGIRGGKKKNVVSGVVLCLLGAAVFFMQAVWATDFSWELMEYHSRSFVTDILNSVGRAVHVTALFLGMVIRWDVLFGRATRLQGYSSEFDRELDFQNRIRARSEKLAVAQTAAETKAVEEPQNTVSETPQTATENTAGRKIDIAEKTSETAGQKDININTCDQEDLMRLPGIGVIQAKRAVEYRSANGGFRSVDEFVELLKIKPHFAVQIFRIAVVDEPAADQPDKAPESGAGGRVFDF